MDNIKIGLFIQSLRKEKGITQNELAEHFGISNKTVSKWECGDALPEIPLLKSLAEYYGVTVDEILNGERNNNISDNVEAHEEVKNKSSFNPASLISFSFNFLMLIIGLSVGLAITNGLVGGLIVLIGAAVSIILYLILAFVFDRSYYVNINKKSILYSLAGNIFVLLLSVIILSKTTKDTMLTFEGLFIYSLELFAIYSFIVLLIDNIISCENYKSKQFIFRTIFLSGMILTGIYLQFVHVYQYIYNSTIDGKRYLNAFSFYENLGSDSSFSILYLPLIFTVITAIISYFSIRNKIRDIITYIFGLVFTILAGIVMLYIDSECPEASYMLVQESRMYAASRFIYVIFILYLLLVLAYIKYFRINKKIKIIRFIDITILIIFVVSTLRLPQVFDPLYDMLEDKDIGLQEMYTHYFLGKILMPLHIVLLLGTIALFILFVVKNINIIFTFVMHLANVILFNISLFVFEQKYNELEAEDMVYVPDFFIIMSIVFYLIIVSILKIKSKKVKEEKEI